MRRRNPGEHRVRKGMQEFTVFRNLGLYQWKQKKNLAEAVAGISGDAIPRGQLQVRLRIRHAVGDPRGPRGAGEAVCQPARTAWANGFAAARYAAWLFDTGRYEETIASLSGKKFALYEGKKTTHRLFAEAHLNLGQRALEKRQYDDAAAHFRAAMTYPWNLGVGRSRGRTDMRAEVLLGLRCGEKATSPAPSRCSRRPWPKAGNIPSPSFR